MHEIIFVPLSRSSDYACRFLLANLGAEYRNQPLKEMHLTTYDHVSTYEVMYYRYRAGTDLFRLVSCHCTEYSVCTAKHNLPDTY